MVASSAPLLLTVMRYWIGSPASTVPLAGIYSSHDEYVPVADARRVTDSAREPKRFWTVAAANHRFSDNLNELDARLCDALAWLSDRGR